MAITLNIACVKPVVAVTHGNAISPESLQEPGRSCVTPSSCSSNATKCNAQKSKWICSEGTPSNLSHGGNQGEAGVGGPAGEGGVGRLRSFGLEEGTLGDGQQQRRSVLSAHRLAVDLVQVQPRPGAEDTLSAR